MQPRGLLLLALLAVMPACGGGNSSNSTPPGMLSGNWEMNLQKDDSTLKPKTQSGFLLQQKDVVTGSVILKATPCSGVGSVNGMVSGSNVALTVSPTGITVNLTGTLGSDQASMSGDYIILPQGCSGSQTAPEMGTWTANLVKPLGGSFTGTFTSVKVGDLPVNGQVTQAANTGSSAPLGGKLMVAGYCFSATNISGAISGTDVVMNLLNSDGSQAGEVTGTSSLDGKSISGKYFAVPQGVGGNPPCVSGDSGTVTLSF